MRAQLLFLSGPTRGRTVTYAEPVVAIGSAAECRARLLDHAVAPRHARIEFRDDGLPAQIEQDGWKVRYLDYDTTRDPPLPSKVFASRGDYQVRLAIRDSRLTFKLAWLNKDKALRKDADEMADWLRKQLEGKCTVQRGTEGAGE